jgi:hypothetical protein
MIKSKKILIPLCIVFALAEIQLSYIIQTAPAPNNWDFISVALACAFCFLFVEKSTSYVFTQLALLFTVGADYFLTYGNNFDQLLGMIFFSFVQIFYFLRLFFEDENKQRRKIHLFGRIAASICVLIATQLVLGDSVDALSLFATFYYFNLLLNLFMSFIQAKGISVFSMGLLCFAICDLFIGFSIISSYIDVGNSAIVQFLKNPGFNIAWVFYVPSQALLSLSLLPKRIKKRV